MAVPEPSATLTGTTGDGTIAPMGNRGDHGRASALDTRRDDAGDDAVADPFAFDSVILPARLESSVARRVAIASNRDGVSIADLLGRAAAAYDWQVEDDLTT